MLVPQPFNSLNASLSLNEIGPDIKRGLFLEMRPHLVVRIDSAGQQYLLGNEKFVPVAQKDINDLSPAWPVPYCVLLTYSSEKSLSFGVIDAFGATVQLNLHFLEAPFEGAALLGGSSRIDPATRNYGVRPSELTAAWIKERVIDWVASKGFDRLYVRAFFEGENGESNASQFFGKLGFVRAPEIGAPYMVVHLDDRDSKAVFRPDASCPEFTMPLENRMIATFLLSYWEMRAMELDYLSAVFNAESEHGKAEAFKHVSQESSGISLDHFAFYWELANPLGRFVAQESARRPHL